MGVCWSHAKTPRREERIEADKSSTHDDPPMLIRPVDSIRNLKLQPTEKVHWRLKQGSQMALGSP